MNASFALTAEFYYLHANGGEYCQGTQCGGWQHIKILL